MLKAVWLCACSAFRHQQRLLCYTDFLSGTNLTGTSKRQIVWDEYHGYLRTAGTAVGIGSRAGRACQSNGEGPGGSRISSGGWSLRFAASKNEIAAHTAAHRPKIGITSESVDRLAKLLWEMISFCLIDKKIRGCRLSIRATSKRQGWTDWHVAVQYNTGALRFWNHDRFSHRRQSADATMVLGTDSTAVVVGGCQCP